jgi:integrase
MISDQTTEKIQLHPTAVQEVFMQQGSIIMSVRKHGPAVWQFRWSESGAQGQRVYRKRVVGTIEEYADSEAVREAFKGLVAKPAPMIQQMKPVVMTLAELCQHFQERELVQDDSWRSYSTRKNYSFLLKRWITPRWGNFGLSEVRTIEVETWLRSLPRARSTCAKIRNLMSVLFNHAWRHEFFDRNPIKLVRQSAKRQTAPSVLTAAEIKALLDHLALRERTLVLLAVSTGLRQSELFALKWGDVDFREGTLHVTRSIAYGVVGRCKTEASQKPVPVHPILAETLLQWRGRCRYRESGDWVFANEHHRGHYPYWGQAILADMGAGAGQVAAGWFDSMYEDVAATGVRFTAVGIVTPDPASVESVLAWANRLQDRVEYVIVENATSALADFTYWRSTKQANQFRQAFAPAILRMEFRLAELENPLRQHGIQLGQVADRKTMVDELKRASLVMRAQSYRRRLFSEFDRAREAFLP